MAIYLLNLGYSTFSTYSSNGSFVTYSSGAPGMLQSCAWYTNTGTAPPVQDTVMQMASLDQAQWGNPVASDTAAFTFTLGDYILLRVFRLPTDDPNNQDLLRVRVGIVFGNGSGNLAAQQNVVQSPLVMVQSGRNFPRAVVDTVSSSGMSWDLGFTTETNSPNPLQKTWVYCLGKIHSQAMDQYFNFNVGVTAYDPNQTVGENLNPNYNLIFPYGKDPTVKVKGAVMDFDGDRDDEDGGRGRREKK